MKFSASPNGPWTDGAAYAGSSGSTTPNNFAYVQVKATPTVPLYFVPVVTATFGAGATYSVTAPALAAAVQQPQSSFTQGLFPFSPVTIAPNAYPNFGLTVGDQYSLRTNNSGCSGETQAYKDAYNSRGNQMHGYWLNGNNNSNAIIQAQITDSYQGGALAIGDQVPLTPGDRQAEFTGNGSVLERIGQDTDASDETYTQYIANGIGNGRRIVVTPISCAGFCTFTTAAGVTYSGNDLVVGFGAFFLLTNMPSGNENYCAEYVGPYIPDTSKPGTSNTGAAKVSLLQ